MNRTDVINTIANEIGAQTYLELGVRNPADNFLKIEVEDKGGVDIQGNHELVFRGTTDEFFAGVPKAGKFDLIFIDADHRQPQNKADLMNALKHLAKGGAIIMHDCLPLSPLAQADEKPPGGGPWNGTVWRTWRYVRSRSDLLSYVVDCDHGCGVIMRGRWKARIQADDEAMTWKNATGWAGLKKEAEFVTREV